MNRIRLVSVVIFGICVFLFPGLVFAGESDGPEAFGLDASLARQVEALMVNPKLTAPQLVLEDFLDGKPTTRVIVNLRRPASIQGTRNFKDMEYRRHLVETVKSSLDRVIRSLNRARVRITNRFTYFPGFAAEVSLEGLEDLVANSEVLSIQKNQIRYANTAQGIPLINASAVRNDYNGSGLSIAICDTGIDYTHPRLGGGGFPNTKVIGGYDCGDKDNDPMDSQGHGTACAGIAAGDPGTVGDYIGGVAYNARLYAVKISYGDGGKARDADMIEGWEWCITHQNDDSDHPIMIISTSFGGGRYLSSCDGDVTAMTAAAANAVAAGMTLFSSSGNEGYCDAMGWPACITHVVSVGAVYDDDLGRNPQKPYVGCIKNESCVGTPGDPCEEKWYVDDPANADQVTTYSNSVSFLTLLAPANWAYTTKLGGGYWDTANGFGGTSAACPYAAGAAACLQSAAKTLDGAYLSPGEVKSALVGTGDPITDGKVSITKPRVNLQAAVNSLDTVNTWLGQTTAWNSTGNWSTGSVPGSSTDVAIPEAPSGGHFPTIDIPYALAQKVTVAGGPVTVKSGTLTMGKGATGPDISYAGTDPYDFGTVDVGSSISHAFTIRNTGSATLNISGASCSGTGFSVEGTVPGTISAGGNGDITVRFSPGSAGSYTGTLGINSDDPDTPTLNIGLKGTGESGSQVASIVFYNDLWCDYFTPVTATLTIDGQQLISTSGGGGSACREFRCGVILNWSLYASAEGCEPVIMEGSRAFDCDCLYEISLWDWFGEIELFPDEICPGDCSDVIQAPAE